MAEQQTINIGGCLNIGQLLNLLDNVNKNYVRKLEKLNKSFVNNKYGISLNNIYIYIIYIYIYIYIKKKKKTLTFFIAQ